LGALGLALVALAARAMGAGQRAPLLLGLGAASLLGALALALRRRPEHEPRLHLVKGRIVALDRGVDDGPTSALVDVHRRLRIRPDGMVRHDPPIDSRLRLHVEAALAESLQRHVGAEVVELVTTTDGVVLALHTESAD
jgi:hypothetical protein